MKKNKVDLAKIGTTGNISADLVIGAMQHYAKFNRTIKIAMLSGSYWRIFKVWMAVQAPELEIRDDGIQFNNVLIRKGSMFQSMSIKCELNPIIAVEDRALPAEIKERKVKPEKKLFSAN